MLRKRIPSISVQELESQLKAKPEIVDVREPGEYRSAHIPGAKNIPLGEMATYHPEQPVYVICQSGMRSKRAAKMLRSNGFDVTNVRGGMSAWSGPIRGGK